MQDIDSGKKLIIDNEEWQYVCQDGETEIDENGKSYRFIYRRLSDDKLFRITNYLCRYGYEDYGFEDGSQDCNAYEVEKKLLSMSGYMRNEKSFVNYKINMLTQC